MKDYDLILVHPPRNFEYLTSNVKARSCYVMMPMGLFALADLLDREGFESKIINYSLERMVNPKFSLIKHIKNFNLKVLGVDLHWVLHSAGAFDILSAVKKYYPSVFTLMGGYSASYFSQEIMSDFEYVDGIIQGDAEKPLVKLMKSLKSSDKDLDKVPNLIYRKDGKIIDNAITWVADELDSMNFANLKFLDHWKEYINYNYKIMHTPWPVEMARGCPHNCVNCAGSNYSQLVISNRKKVIFRSPSRVLDDIRAYLELSDVKGVFYGHGVYPETEKYFMEIQKLLREEKLDIHADLEIWRLPLSKEFIRDFAKTHSYYLDKSLLWFSVRSFSQAYRKKFNKLHNKFDNSFDFSNKDLKKLMHDIKQYNIPLRLFWDVGNPYETGLNLLDNFLYALKILINNISKNSKVSMWSEPINVSPGCPIDLLSHHFGYKLHANNLKDYLLLNKKSKMRMPPIDVGVNFHTDYLATPGINMMNKLMVLLDFISVITV